MKTKLFFLAIIATICFACKSDTVSPYVDVINGGEMAVNIYIDNNKVCSVSPYSNSAFNVSPYYGKPSLLELQWVKTNGSSASKSATYTFKRKYNYKINIGTSNWEVRPYLP